MAAPMIITALSGQEENVFAWTVFSATETLTGLLSVRVDWDSLPPSGSLGGNTFSDLGTHPKVI